VSVATIPPPPIDGFQIGPLDVRLYGILIAIGAFLALRMTVRRFAASGGDPAIAEKAALLALIGGFTGARIGYVIPRLERFLENPVDILLVRQGGLVFFGGLAGGALAVYVYVRAKGASMPAMADAVAPALPLAQAVGRWGNYFNQELFGRPTALPWALEVEPDQAAQAGYLVERTFHPTFLYESLWNFALVAVLLRIDRRGSLSRRGSLFFVYLIGYGIGRGWIEWLRIDTVERYFGLSRNNWIAIGIVVFGLIGLMWWERRATAPLVADIEVADDAETTDDAEATDELGTVTADDAEEDAEVTDEPGPVTAEDAEVTDEPGPVTAEDPEATDELDAAPRDPGVADDLDATAADDGRAPATVAGAGAAHDPASSVVQAEGDLGTAGDSRSSSGLADGGDPGTGKRTTHEDPATDDDPILDPVMGDDPADGDALDDPADGDALDDPASDEPRSIDPAGHDDPASHDEASRGATPAAHAEGEDDRGGTPTSGSA